MNQIAVLFFTILLLSTAGCSDRQVYDALQKRGRIECQNLPEVEYEECIKDYQESYDDYKKALDEAQDRQ